MTAADEELVSRRCRGSGFPAAAAADDTIFTFPVIEHRKYHRHLPWKAIKSFSWG